MSMPTFPEDGIEISKEQAFNMLLGSIAMEELALSHIMNAEGEKLQYILGMLPSKQPPYPPTPNEVLKINQSITLLLENVSHNQLLLKSKLQQVLEAREKWFPPCPPSCPKHTTWVFHGTNNEQWKMGCPLNWKQVYSSESGHCLKCSTHTMFRLERKCAYQIGYSFRLCDCESRHISIALQCRTDNGYETILMDEAQPIQPETSIHISGYTVLSPDECGLTPSPIRFVLLSPEHVFVEKAILNITLL